MQKLKKFLNKFENEIVVEGIKSKELGKRIVISSKDGKLASTPFGKFIGLEIPQDSVCAIEYWGHIKKSTGLLKEIQYMKQKTHKNIHIPTIVVIFASIKTNNLLKIGCLSEQDIGEFFMFKEQLVKMRWN